MVENSRDKKKISQRLVKKKSKKYKKIQEMNTNLVLLLVVAALVVVVFVVSSVSFIRSFFQTSNEDALLAKVSGDRDFSDLF